MPPNHEALTFDFNRVPPEILTPAKQEIGLQDKVPGAMTADEKVSSFIGVRFDHC